MKHTRWVIKTSTGDLLGEPRDGWWHVCRWKTRENAEHVRQSFAMAARYTVACVPLRIIRVAETECNAKYNTPHARAMRKAEDEVSRSIRCKTTTRTMRS